jgi:hypothetical protein
MFWVRVAKARFCPDEIHHSTGNIFWRNIPFKQDFFIVEHLLGLSPDQVFHRRFGGVRELVFDGSKANRIDGDPAARNFLSGSAPQSNRGMFDLWQTSLRRSGGHPHRGAAGQACGRACD